MRFSVHVILVTINIFGAHSRLFVEPQDGMSLINLGNELNLTCWYNPSNAALDRISWILEQNETTVGTIHIWIPAGGGVETVDPRWKDRVRVSRSPGISAIVLSEFSGNETGTYIGNIEAFEGRNSCRYTVDIMETTTLGSTTVVLTTNTDETTTLLSPTNTTNATYEAFSQSVCVSDPGKKGGVSCGAISFIISLGTLIFTLKCTKTCLEKCKQNDKQTCDHPESQVALGTDISQESPKYYRNARNETPETGVTPEEKKSRQENCKKEQSNPVDEEKESFRHCCIVRGVASFFLILGLALFIAFLAIPVC